MLIQNAKMCKRVAPYSIRHAKRQIKLMYDPHGTARFKLLFTHVYPDPKDFARRVYHERVYEISAVQYRELKARLGEPDKNSHFFMTNILAYTRQKNRRAARV